MKLKDDMKTIWNFVTQCFSWFAQIGVWTLYGGASGLWIMYRLRIPKKTCPALPCEGTFKKRGRKTKKPLPCLTCISFGTLYWNCILPDVKRFGVDIRFSKSRISKTTSQALLLLWRLDFQLFVRDVLILRWVKKIGKADLGVRWLSVPPLPVLQGDYVEAQLLLVKERTQV